MLENQETRSNGALMPGKNNYLLKRRGVSQTPPAVSREVRERVRRRVPRLRPWRHLMVQVLDMLCRRR
jgi:hypothetical protein